MCGFYFQIDKEKITASIAQKALASIKNRGPDYQDYKLMENDTVLLVHARLSLMDLSLAGSQPMYNLAGTAVIVFNGEIYNHQKLRSIYFPPHHPWKSSCDTETLVELLSILDLEKVLDIIDGPFAFVLYDLKKKLVITARDKFGEKPIHYKLNASSFIASSSLKALKDDTTEIDLNSVKLFFKYGFIPAPKSIYKDIYKLEPGTYLVFDQSKGTVSKKKYFNIGALANEGTTKSINVTSLRSQLISNVSQAFTSDTPGAIALSSGVDSSLIALLKTMISREKIASYTVSFAGDEFDESSKAEKFADNLNLRHNNLYFHNQSEISEAFELHCSHIFEEPFADASALPMAFLAKNMKSSFKFGLAGDGADELFLGYNRYILAYWLDKMKIWRMNFRGPIMSLIGSLIKITWVKKCLKWYVGTNMNELDKKIKKLENIIGRRTAKDMYCKILEGDITDLSGLLVIPGEHQEVDPVKDVELDSGLSLVETFRRLDLNFYLPDMVLTKTDRTSMYFGFEFRTPYLTERMLTAANEFGVKGNIKHGVTKQPLRSLLKELVIESEFGSQKKLGFTPPLKVWMKSCLATYLSKFSDRRIIAEQGLFNGNFVNTHILNGDSEDLLWRYLVFQSWYEAQFK